MSQTKSTTSPKVSRARNKTQLVFIQGQEALAQLKINSVKEIHPESLKGIKAVYKRVRDYDFINLSVEFAMELHKYHLKIDRNLPEAKRLKEQCKHFNRLLCLDNEVKLEFQELQFRYNSRMSRRKELLDDLTRFCENYKQHLKIGNAQISHRVFIIQIAKAFLENDLELAISICNEALKLLSGKRIEKTAIYNSYLAAARTMLGEFKEARKVVELSLQQSNKGGENWLMWLRQGVITEFHAQDYQQAFKLFSQGERYKSVDQSLFEQFNIIKGYLNLLHRNELIPEGKLFRLGKFLNEVPIFSRDKAGNNINILILQILHRLDSGRGWLIDHSDAIKQYCSDHLRGNKRARTFIRMLLKIPRYSFNRPAIERMATADLQMLQETQKDRDLDIEIFPYEDLWGLALESI